MDVDGTLTDGKIYIGENVEPEYGIIPVIITARKSKILELRCGELNIRDLYQGVRDKTRQIEEILTKYSAKDGVTYAFANCAYIGDNILDLSPIMAVKSTGGSTAAPADAANEVKTAVDFVCEKTAAAVRLENWLNGLFIE